MLNVISYRGILGALFLFFVAALTVVSMPKRAAADAPVGITDCAGLAAMSDDLAGSYQLQADIIDCRSSEPVPVGSTGTPFTGTFDGNHKTILGLSISEAADNLGLFGAIQGATIQNVTFKNSSVGGLNNVGLLAGNAIAPNTISGITSDNATISGYTGVGGLIGQTNAGTGTTTLTDVYAHGSVTSSHDNAGGLVGDSEGNTEILRAATGGTVHASGYLGGGLAGYAYLMTIYQSFSTSSVVVQYSHCCAGGLVGEGDIYTIKDSYAAGSAIVSDSLGGIIGEDDGGYIINSYALTGMDGGSTHVGGINGYGGATVVNSFWSIPTTGQGASAGGSGKSDEDMRLQGTYTGWDFGSVWGIDPLLNGGYPYLLWQHFAPAQVTGLSASVASDSQINLSWSAPTGTITGYKIERKLAGGSYSTLVADTGTTGTTYHDTDLPALTHYYYKVSAINDMGTGAASAEADGTTTAVAAGAECVPDLYFKFDEADGDFATDSSGSGHTGIFVNSPESVSDVPPVSFSDPYARRFVVDESTQVTFAKNVSNTFSVSFWLKTAGQQQDYGSILSQSNEAGFYYKGNDSGGIDNNRISMYYGDAGDHENNAQLSLNTWHHIAFVSNAGHGTFYIDGVADATMDDVPALRFSTIGSDPNPENFVGTLDDMRIYDSALSADDVGELAGGAQHCSAPADAPPQSHGSNGPVSGPLSVGSSGGWGGSFVPVAPGATAPGAPAAPIAATGYQFTRTLRQGMSGADVLALQKFLNAHGFIIAASGPGSPGNESDFFGGKTKAAVIKFQLAHGLPGVGILGPLTRALLNRL